MVESDEGQQETKQRMRLQTADSADVQSYVASSPAASATTRNRSKSQEDGDEDDEGGASEASTKQPGSPQVREPFMIPIEVLAFNGATVIHGDFSSEDTTFAMKEQVKLAHSVPCWQQSFQWRGKLLAPCKSLADLGLTSRGAKLRLLLHQGLDRLTYQARRGVLEQVTTSLRSVTPAEYKLMRSWLAPPHPPHATFGACVYLLAGTSSPQIQCDREGNPKDAGWTLMQKLLADRSLLSYCNEVRAQIDDYKFFAPRVLAARRYLEETTHSQVEKVSRASGCFYAWAMAVCDYHDFVLTMNQRFPDISIKEVMAEPAVELHLVKEEPEEEFIPTPQSSEASDDDDD
eukprot:TRINITY_DN90982_c0_g1_i1.p1 TRINITY_DN90982_c0_g1~~TRINITY_DN90982_c0_g1_i1.p1  ORF type:complete len:346 (-),score=86.49 TRINITY_DN90982_c0_g1_i1:14-1051(-)